MADAKLHIRTRLGFTFTEVLFAVMLLGIGFIMVAAIFPVAIQQSRSSLDDTMGVSIARTGANVMAQRGGSLPDLVSQAQFGFGPLGYGFLPCPNPWDTSFPPPPRTPVYNPAGGGAGWRAYPESRLVYPFYSYASPGQFWTIYLQSGNANWTLYDQLKRNLIVPDDPRYAWVPMGYRLGPGRTIDRDGASPIRHDFFIPDYYEVFVVSVRARATDAYQPADLEASKSTRATFVPKPVMFVLTEGQPFNQPDTLRFLDPQSNAITDHPYAAAGAFVLVCCDQYTVGGGSQPYWEAGRLNGRFYRLANRIDVGTWELDPAWSMTWNPGPDGQAGTDDDYNENLPHRTVSAPPDSGPPAIGLMIGRQLPDEGLAQDLYATSVRIMLPK